jgi:hypothetical protein
LNILSGNGSASSTVTLPNGDKISNNFGVGLVGISKDNLIEKNTIGGNLNGVFIASTTLGGNVFRRNIIAGNPPVQVSNEFPSIGADIQDLSNPALGANIFEDNRCLTYSGAEPSPCPNVGKPGEDEEQEAVAAFSRNRLAFPQARLVEAVFRPSSRYLPQAVVSSGGSQTPEPNSVVLTGKVVDAACYMLHAAAATSPSHLECGAACLARGTPLAIATEDGTLYFPADGNKQLKVLLNAHVRATGTVVEKHEPMELKMPVGEKNQMVVRLEGGYKQIAIETLAKMPAEKR